MKLEKTPLIVLLIVLSFLAACTYTEDVARPVPSKIVKEEIIDQTEKDITDNDAELDELTVIADTNQDKCYDDINQIECPSKDDDFYGQDSQYKGNVPSYRDNGDGTVTDLNTGLMWIKKAGEKIDYYAAKESISFAEYDDWRIPSIKELYTLMDFRGVDPDSQATDESELIPFIDTEHFDFKYGDIDQGDRIIDSQWITSTVYVSKVMNNEECFFGVNFADGRIKCYPTGKEKSYYIRYVRGESYGENEFFDNGDGTVSDLSSGLMWQRKDSEKSLDWKESLEYCENLVLADHDDWRLPNAKELEYIVDYSRSPDTTDSAAISSVFISSTITNELGEEDYPYYWTSTTHLSHVDAKSAAYISFGRGIGQMRGEWMDVHGAGCQRSDPKSGNKEDYPQSFGPQGDARRVYNHARCVRGGAEAVYVESEEVSFSTKDSEDMQGSKTPPMPPEHAIDACESEGSACSFQSPTGSVSGTCKDVGEVIACVP